MTALLPLSVGYVLPVDQRPEPSRDLIEGVVADAGLSAIAIADRKVRTAAGVDLVLGVMRPVGSLVLGRRVARTVSSVLVIAASPSTARAYRGATVGDNRVTVAAARPWDGQDENYWPAWHALAAGSELTVIDTVQQLANGNVTFRHVRGLEEFPSPVVGLYAGNATSPGVGGDIAWSGAVHRCWYGGRGSNAPLLMHALDTDDAPWEPAITRYIDLTGALAAERNDLTAEQVADLGRLARRVDHRGAPGPQATSELLLAQFFGDVTRICGRSVERANELAAAIARHDDAWRGGLGVSPTSSTPTSEEPPF